MIFVCVCAAGDLKSKPEWFYKSETSSNMKPWLLLSPLALRSKRLKPYLGWWQKIDPCLWLENLHKRVVYSKGIFVLLDFFQHVFFALDFAKKTLIFHINHLDPETDRFFQNMPITSSHCVSWRVLRSKSFLGSSLKEVLEAKGFFSPAAFNSTSKLIWKCDGLAGHEKNAHIL